MMQDNPQYCWSCQSFLDDDIFFCSVCSIVQPLRTNDPFVVFSCDADYNMDAAVLEKTYLALQRRLHPDRFLNAGKKEKMAAQMASASVNQAYDTLCDPVRRAIALLRRVGIKAEAGSENTIQDPELLMEAMTMREALSEARDEDGIGKIAKEVDGCRESVTGEIAQSWRQGEHETMNRLLTRLKYFIKLDDELASARRRISAPREPSTRKSALGESATGKSSTMVAES